MKMLKKLLNSYQLQITLFILMSLLVCSCNTSKNSSSVLKIDNRHMIFEVNDLLQTRFTTSLPETKSIFDGFQSSEVLVLNNNELTEFKYVKTEENSLSGDLTGKQWVIEGTLSNGIYNITKKLILTVYNDFPDLISTKVVYTNNADDDVFIQKWVNNDYTILSKEDQPIFWAFQGSSTAERSDWITPLEQGYYKKNYLGMNDTDYGGGIPVTSVWRPDVNIAVGHLALVPKMVSLPTEIPAKENDVKISVSEDFKERTIFESGDSLETLETFVSISKGDYFENLSRYSNLMQAKGIKMVETEEEAYESIWCAWGYERKFTYDEIIKTLPKVKELGIKWAVLDDGFQIAEGDWNIPPKRFPYGNRDIKNLVDNIHSYGLKAKLWWAPLAADPHSKLLQDNSDMMVIQKDGSPQFITWWNAYYLSPTKEATIAHTKETVKLFMDEWGFDGLKMDGQHMNAVAPDYSLENPNDSFEGVPAFFQMIYDEARSIKPNAVIENCPCGACMSYFNMASMNQAVSSDPSVAGTPKASFQIRHKGKTYKALVPNAAYYGDHVELSDKANDFASSFGIGGVLGTKFTWPKDNPHAEESQLLTPEKEIIWKKWFSLYDKKMLSKEEYLGGLYDIGYDKPETHAIKKGDVLHYAFYDKNWNGDVTLKGLEEGKSYKIRDYFNNIDLSEVSASEPSIKVAFEGFLLIEAIPIN